ncbi:MAG: hypothetical protein CMH56_14160 [Myxococcales bacterium]|nr:hypothetical protein [Myxococcales bacterium]|tara:strand:+ start:121 stop:783 length:663 start_codon:yes stop_codon:yes gene_type:complete
MKKLNWTIALATLLSLALFPACIDTTTAVADDDDRGLSAQNTDGSGDGSSDGSTDGNSDGSTDGSSDGSTDGSSTDLTALCTEVCEKTKECMDPVCTQDVVGDIAACANQCAADPSATEVSLNQYLAASCDEIVAANCTVAGIAEVCTCPEPSTGDCPEGLFCMGFSDGTNTFYLCSNQDGSYPADAPMCDNSNPCEATHMCVVSSAGATSGSCLQTCTQ